LCNFTISLWLFQYLFYIFCQANYFLFFYYTLLLNSGKIKKDLKDKKCLIEPFYMLIAAHAKSLKMTLVTNNTKEFERINKLKIEDWTK